MLIKLETKSARVKGLSFHPKRPWVLASLHNGTIQLWDYQVSTMIDKFDEHDGPVRGICFHMNQSLFVSGGDDYKVKVWNYKLRKCMFTLFGHLDYIRTTYFHHNYPWIVSASDDQTIRIWNWQSRNCLAMLTGHNHYVMCANFHPTEDLIVSASLDQTVRVWDIKGLRQKCVTPTTHEHHPYRMPNSSELFGLNDVVVRLVLEGHDRGVNWASFHPTLPLIVSGGDDRLVKLWRMNELKAWEVDTCRGHYNNVSCVMFHPRADVIISNSEDKSLRVWDMTKRTCLRTFRREHDRFWVLTVHPTLNVFAAGTDNGFLIFKLERERPVFAIVDHYLFYVKEKQIRQLDFKTSADTAVVTTKLPARSVPFRIECNLYEKACLLTWHASNQESHNFEYISMPTAATSATATATTSDSVSETRFKTNGGDICKGTGFVTVWLTRNRFVVLDRPNNQLIVRNSKMELLKKIPLPKSGYDDMFFVGNGNVLLRDAEEVVLFDVQQKRVEASVRVSKCKYVHWSVGQEYVALLSKNDITICNRQLEMLCIVHENVRVKSGAWDRRNVFVYTTSNHIKYCLLNGDYGIIRTLDLPLYVTRIDDDRIYCLDREAKPCILNVDTTEYKFKWALVNRKYENVLEVVRNAKLIGQSIISYLQQKGYPEVALFFVKDNRIRFSLALDCGNLQVALEAARALNDPQCWQRLGQVALLQGNLTIVELCLQNNKNFEQLTFLYLICGQFEKLRKMMRIAQVRNDVSAQYQSSLLLGDVREQVRLLKQCGNEALAELTAKTYGFNDEVSGGGGGGVDGNEVALDPIVPDANARFLRAPIPVQQVSGDWPFLVVSSGFFETMPTLLKTTGDGKNDDIVTSMAAMSVDNGADGGETGGRAWGDDVDLGSDADEIVSINDDDDDDDDVEGNKKVDGSGGGWDIGDDDIIVPDDLTLNDDVIDSEFTVTQPGRSETSVAVANSRLPVDHIAAGSFSNAFRLLHEQIGIVNFEPYKNLFMDVYARNRPMVSTLPDLPSLSTAMLRKRTEPEAGVLSTFIEIDSLIRNLQDCYKSVTEAKFADAINKFEDILLKVPLLSVVDRKAYKEALELIRIACEYLTSLKMETERRNLAKNRPDELIRQCEMAAYFTHCQLQPSHRILTLRTALNLFYKTKNFKTAVSFARRLLELGPGNDVAQNARKLLQICESTGTGDTFAGKLNYDEHNPFRLCAMTFVPIYRGQPEVQCAFCNAAYLPQFVGCLCNICRIAEIGYAASGLVISAPKFARK